MGRLTYFQIVLFLFCGVASIGLTGCDVSNSNRDKVSTQEPFFNFEVLDENGEVLTVASSEQLNGKEIETGIGLFGEQFVSPDFIERLQENIGFEISLEAFRELEIILHAEEGVGDSVRFAMLKFRFGGLDQWEEGRFEVSGRSKEEQLDRLRHLFEFHRQIREDIMEGRMPPQQDSVYFVPTQDSVQFVPIDTDSADTIDPIQINKHTVFISYGQSFNAPGPRYTLSPVDGVVELRKVTDDQIEGSFNLTLGGVRADIFLEEVFPEDPEFRTFNIHGEFVTEHGNYEDLARIKAEHIKELLEEAAASGGGVGFIGF